MPKLTKRQLKEEFHKFLRENDCASKFYVNFYHPKAKKWRRINKIEYKFRYNVIAYAFQWDGSPEGVDYWDAIDDLWEKRYKELTA